MEEKVRMNTKEFIGGIIGAFTFYLITKKEYKAQEVDGLLEKIYKLRKEIELVDVTETGKFSIEEKEALIIPSEEDRLLRAYRQAHEVLQVLEKYWYIDYCKELLSRLNLNKIDTDLDNAISILQELKDRIRKIKLKVEG